jgi:hypothetical protein
VKKTWNFSELRGIHLSNIIIVIIIIIIIIGSDVGTMIRNEQISEMGRSFKSTWIFEVWRGTNRAAER